MRNDLNGCWVYCGYYTLSPKNPTLLCVSDTRKMVKNYLKIYRRLSKEEYSIEKIFVSYIRLIDDLDIYVISEWNGHYIPAIDQIHIGTLENQNTEFLFNSIRNLNRVVGYVRDIKGVSKEDISILSLAVSVLLKISKKVNIGKKFDEIYQNEILYAPIEEHIKHINDTINLMCLNRETNDAWDRWAD